jgi:hypothetical protein
LRREGVSEGVTVREYRLKARAGRVQLGGEGEGERGRQAAAAELEGELEGEISSAATGDFRQREIEGESAHSGRVQATAAAGQGGDGADMREVQKKKRGAPSLESSFQKSAIAFRLDTDASGAVELT